MFICFISGITKFKSHSSVKEVTYKHPYNIYCDDFVGESMKIAWPYYLEKASNSLSCVTQGDCFMVRKFK